MGGINSFLLKAFSWFLLAFACICLFTATVAFFLDGELVILTQKLKTSLMPFIQENFANQPVINETTFLTLKSTCESAASPSTICNLMANGTINDSATFSAYLSSTYVSVAVDSAALQRLPLTDSLLEAGNLAKFFLFVSFFLALFVLYLETGGVRPALRSLAGRLAVFCVLTLVFCIILLIAIPSLAPLLTGQKPASMDLKMVSQLALAVTIIGEWATNYVLKVAAVFVALLAVSLVSFYLLKPAKK